MKLLFLDIDGVMTSDALNLEKGSDGKIYPFSSSCVAALNEILRSNKVKIILTSSWRTVFDIEKQCQVFKENGVVQFPSGETADLGFENRGDEIKAYLQNRNVDSFIILDDMEINGFGEHFLKIDPSFGLTAKHAHEANRILAKHNR